MRAFDLIPVMFGLDIFVSGGVLYKDSYRLDIIHYNDFHARCVKSVNHMASLVDSGLYYSHCERKPVPRSGIVKVEVYSLDRFLDFSTVKLSTRFEETSVDYPMCTSNDTNCLGGFARLYYEIQALLKEKPGALLLNAGDTFQGSYWYTLLKWNVTQEFINMLPNDAHAIGNHEFDDGIAGLAPYLAALRAPVLAANLNTSQEPSLSGLYKPHVVVERNGRRIGIIGLITPDTKTSSNAQKAIFLDPIQVVQDEARSLADKGVDITVVLSHCGLEVDKKIAETVGENIDVIVGGHSHSLLWNGKPPGKDFVSGPYPVLVETQSTPGHKVLVITASAFTKYLGNITIYFDNKGELQSFEGEPVYLNRSIPEDPEILKLMQPYKTKLQKLVQEVAGFAADDLLADPCGSGECAIGDVIADGFLSATKASNVSNLPHVVFYLRNMIRGSISKGDITRGALINALPFTNTVTTASIRGKYLVEAFKKAMGTHWTSKPFRGPMVPQVSGLKLQINVTDLNDIKIDVLVKEEDGMKPINMEKEYQLITLDFIIRGGGGLNMIKENAQNIKTIGKDTDVLEPYIRNVSPIYATLDNRLNIIN